MAPVCRRRFCEPGTSVSRLVDFDTDQGPIVIRNGAQVGRLPTCRAPVAGCRQRRQTARPDQTGTHVGKRSKVGGEVAASVIEAYSNKQHHGYLGHAYVGSWVNLGAGTSNSDLKNTYGNINIEINGRPISTQMQLLGCLVGDYAKTAINTNIYTGKLVGVASMLYGTVTRAVPSFVNYARSLGGESAVTPEVVIRMQQRMFARRDVPHRPCDAELIRAVHALTADSRQGLTVGPVPL